LDAEVFSIHKSEGKSMLYAAKDDLKILISFFNTLDKSMHNIHGNTSWLKSASMDNSKT
jgi:hypothetical protein